MVQQKTAVIWHLSLRPTNLVFFEPLSSIVQEDEETIVTPVFGPKLWRNLFHCDCFYY